MAHAVNINNITCSLLTVLSCCLSTPLRAAETGPAQPALPKVKPVSGKVTEILNAGGYTYLQLTDGNQKLWVATYASFKVAQGDEVHVTDYMVMENFKSPTLKRTFDSVLFTSFVQVGSETNATMAVLPPGHPVPSQEPSQVPKVKKGSVSKAQDGYTVEQCFAKQKTLENKRIKIRGVVVKFTPEIMGRNWVHIQDGTGRTGTDDLVVTTKDNAQLGDVVVITGLMRYNKNFGAGYSYPAIIEEASLQREKAYQP